MPSICGTDKARAPARSAQNQQADTAGSGVAGEISDRVAKSSRNDLNEFSP
jgi:hypothetical protein